MTINLPSTIYKTPEGKFKFEPPHPDVDEIQDEDIQYDLSIRPEKNRVFFDYTNFEGEELEYLEVAEIILMANFDQIQECLYQWDDDEELPQTNPN